MRRRLLFIITLVGIVCLVSLHVRSVEAAGPVFFADFDTAGIPNNDVNDAASWVSENAGNTWAIGDFPANGTKCLKMTGGGCGSSGYTPFPMLENWSNGIIQIDLGWFDDDSWGIMFRGESLQSGYFAFFGYAETLDLALFDLGVLGLNSGQCLNETGVEEGPEPGSTIIDGMSLAKARHNLDTADRAGAVSHTARIVANGANIKIWYGLTENFPDDPLKDPDPNSVPTMIEVEDATYTEGAIGIWQESNDGGVVDNIYVFDGSALTVVDSEDKLTTMWGQIKN